MQILPILYLLKGGVHISAGGAVNLTTKSFHSGVRLGVVFIHTESYTISHRYVIISSCHTANLFI